ncbi:MAG: RHS repeat-associated core domain-containing protein, partial [Akkermansia sp.]
YGEVSASGNITQPIQWSSEYHDVELGLVYYNYRHYNSVDGRWLRRDPAFWNFNVYLMMPPTVNVDHLGLRTVSKKKKCCPERVVVEYDNQIYDDKLEEIDRENIKGWLQQDRHDKINDLALIPEQRAKYGVFPYGLLHSELSMEKLEQLFEGHNSLLAELIRVRKRLKIRTNHTGQPGKFGYHGFIRRGLLTVRFPEKSKCKPFSFRIQAGGRASGFLPEELQTTAPLPGSGYIYQKGNQGIIAGYPIGMGEDPKAGVWGEQREGIMIHLAPATGYGERRQIGSHGCISTHDETGWRRFVEAMSGCSKIPIYIIQG